MKRGTSTKRITFGICGVSVLTAVGVIRAAGPEPVIVIRDPHGEDSSQWAVPDKERAITKVRELLGIPGREDLAAEAKAVLLAEDNTPFLSGQVIGRPVWHVVISGWRLQLKSAPSDAKDSYVRTCDIFLGAEQGHLLKIVSRWPEGVPLIPPEPGPASYTDQLRCSGNEKYYDFPAEAPPITFVDALDGVFRSQNVLNVEQIVGQYVVWSRMGRDPKPVWVITLRDTEPLWLSRFPEGGSSGQNHMRYIVDPLTGEWLCASSTPRPVTLEDKPAGQVGGRVPRPVEPESP